MHLLVCSRYLNLQNQCPPLSCWVLLFNPRSGSTKWKRNIIVLSFDSVYMKKSQQEDRKFLLRNSLVKLLVYRNKYGGEKQHILSVSSATSITYKLIVLLNKRRNFQAKQNQFFIKRMNVCFKKIKIIAEVSLSENSRKWEI